MNVIKSAEQLNELIETPVPSQSVPVAESNVDEWILATHGRTFHFASRFLAPRVRRDVITLYAFFRTLDDLVDIPVEGRSIEDVRIELDAWKSWFLGGRSFAAPREPLGSRLADVLAKHCVPTSIFLDFLDGMAFDLEPQQISSFRELYGYCYQVAGTVGLAITHILGVHSGQALTAAENLGIAMQLTNILRDIGGDLALSRIYLPQEDLERFDCTSEHLAQLYRKQHCDDRFRALMRFQVARAHYYYVRGMSGIWLLPRECRFPILVASRLYRRILTKIEHRGYDVLNSRASTSFPEKVREAAIAFMLERLWSGGEGHLNPEGVVFLES